MLLDTSNMTRHHVDEYMAENNIFPHQILEVTTMDLLIEFAEDWPGICLSSVKELVQKELDSGMLVEIPLDIPIHRRTIGFAYHPANQAIGPKNISGVFVLIFRTYIFPYVSCPLFCIYKTGGFPGFFRGIRLFFILTCIRQDPRTQSM